MINGKPLRAWVIAIERFQFRVKAWAINHPDPTLREKRQFEKWKQSRNPVLREQFTQWAVQLPKPWEALLDRQSIEQARTYARMKP